ncbi:hypothetical protein RIR_jg39253.t3 [Rhizophagus irregularis DAOM 181602=DAOM 197198]|nr:hypothetical protein RIR_jg39253.t3 [Rhizophagus irregularis DAOM 181602=DAOM 197198]
MIASRQSVCASGSNIDRWIGKNQLHHILFQSLSLFPDKSTIAIEAKDADTNAPGFTCKSSVFNTRVRGEVCRKSLFLGVSVCVSRDYTLLPDHSTRKGGKGTNRQNSNSDWTQTFACLTLISTSFSLRHACQTKDTKNNVMQYVRDIIVKIEQAKWQNKGNKTNKEDEVLFAVNVYYSLLKEAIDSQGQEEVKDATSGEEAKKVTKVSKENKVGPFRLSK